MLFLVLEISMIGKFLLGFSKMLHRLVNRN
jgi:hypothetical protein